MQQYLWSYCLIAGILLLLLAIVIFGKKRTEKLPTVFFLIITAGFLSYIPQYLEIYGITNAITADIVNILQIITLNSNTYETAQGTIPKGFLGAVCLFIRGCVHVCLPVIFGYVAFRFLTRGLIILLFRYKCLSANHIYFFSDYTDEAEMLARDIERKDNENKSVFVFFHTKTSAQLANFTAKDKLDYGKFLFSEIGLLDSSLAIPEELAAIKGWREKLLEYLREHRKFGAKYKDTYYFCSSADMKINVRTGLSILQVYSDRSRELQKSIHLRIISDEPYLDEELIDSANVKGEIDVRVINPYRMAVYDMLWRNPLYTAFYQDEGYNKEKNLSVLIAGFSQTGVEALRAISWCGQIHNAKLKIRILAKPEDKANEEFLRLYCPELFNGEYDIRFISLDLDSREMPVVLQKYCADTNYIVVCRNDDNDSLRTALYLRRYYFKADGKYTKKPKISLYIRSDERRMAITAENDACMSSQYEWFTFGNTCEIYSHRVFVNSEVELLARCCDRAYAFGKEKDVTYYEFESYIDSFDSLSEFEKRSNVARAIHIKYDLWHLGVEYPEKIAFMSEDEFACFLEKVNSSMSDAVHFQGMCIAEHNRWMTFHRAEGWESLSLEDGRKVAYLDLTEKNKKGVSKLKSKILKMHPDICEYERIKTIREQLGSEDTTPYDSAMIKRIPHILRYVRQQGIRSQNEE